MPRILLTLSFLFFSILSFAQPTLPDILAGTEKGINILTWTNQYEGIKSIAVQRSSDSIFNYVTVGYVKNLKKGQQAFIDGHPVPGKNFYRLYIVFNSDLAWNSNRVRLEVDSATIAAKGVVPPNDSLQRLAASIKMKVDTASGRSTLTTTSSSVSSVTPGTATDSLAKTLSSIKLSLPVSNDLNSFNYIRSQYVFTNPFTGHVNIEVPDVNKHRYSVVFTTQQKKKLFEIARVTESPIIIDKRNFQQKGLFQFELKKDDVKIETGYITIY
ncbi:MAG: hypothetical protein EOP51_11325 [Sphingobacteriales bacterium]|nr:MAG: hypothetical protein EOP51_11325 [Sphingobacteriales bacterium]